MHQEVVVSALDFDDACKAVHALEEAFAVGEVVACACEREVHGEACCACDAVNQRFDRLHADDERRFAVCRNVRVSGDKFDPRFEFLDDVLDPGRLHDAVGVREAEDFAVAGFDHLADGLFLGTHSFGNGVDCEYVQAFKLCFVFCENLRGVVRGAVIGHPDFPFALVILREYGVERFADAFGFVTRCNQDAYLRERFRIGKAFAYAPERTVEPHF